MISVGSMVQIHPDPPLTRPGVGGRYEKGSDGAIAQLGERLLCKQEVTGSIPVGSTSVLADGKWRSREKVEESEGSAFVLFWLLREVSNRLIFKNSGNMKVVCWRCVGLLS